MQPDLNLLADTTGIPKKKWFESEQRRDLFFLCTVVQARYRLRKAIHYKVEEKRGFFWIRRSECEVELENDYFQMKITIYEGRGSSKNHVFGKLIERANGTVVQIVVRDRITLNFIPALAFPLFCGIWITRDLTIIVFLFFFYGFLGVLGAIIERKENLNEAIKVITNIVSA